MRWLLAQIFERLTLLRAWLYRRGVFKSRSLRRPVISIGNLTLGGTGKTPFVAYLARFLVQASYQPIILSRGYLGTAETHGQIVSDGERIYCRHTVCGDEPYLLARNLPGVAVVVGKDRYDAGRRLENRFSKGIHLLDDGFQHLALKRDLDILLIDATDPFGGGRLVPAGRLREPVSAIQRADLVVVTRSHLARNSEEIETVIRKINPLVPVHYFYHDLVGLIDLKTGREQPLRAWINRPVAVLAALGNPAVLLADLSHYQLKVVQQFLYRDHHPYSQAELDRALEPLREGSAEALITTEKDAVRLQDLEFGPGQLLAVQIEVHAEDDREYQRYLLEELRSLEPKLKGDSAS